MKELENRGIRERRNRRTKTTIDQEKKRKNLSFKPIDPLRRCSQAEKIDNILK